jgi:phosphate transport system substrate-binding protein
MEGMMQKTGIFLILILLFSCQKHERMNSPTQGEITVFTDEAFYPLVIQWAEVFSSIYTEAKVKVQIVPQEYAIQKLLNLETPLIFVSRTLDEHEQAFIKRKLHIARQHFVAKDAICLLIHPKNTDSLLTQKKLQAIFHNQYDVKITPVFAQNHSSNLQWIADKFLKINTKACYALPSHQKVIDFVSKNPQAMGVIGMSWLSDFRDNTQQKAVLQNVKMASISTPKDSSIFYQPYQSQIATNQYPLSRQIFAIHTEPKVGLATGFVSFILSEKGQRIVLKSGLVPANMPSREIDVYKNQ